MNIESESNDNQYNYFYNNTSNWSSPSTRHNNYPINELIERTQYYNLDTLIPEFQNFGLSEQPRDQQQHNTQNLYTSFDIFGNEISIENRNFHFQHFNDYSQPEPIPIVPNKENNDPVYNMITPMKRRTDQRSESRRGSTTLNRSPLLDITPPAPKKKLPSQDIKVEV